tara:strand:- start:641 stop:889 length:249 start_codon:yes stop_codon:yes gene_type:complete
MSDGSKFYFLDDDDDGVWKEIDNTSVATEITENIGILDTAIRVVITEKQQRFCLKCGKIMPTKIPMNYHHKCERPDFVKNAL